MQTKTGFSKNTIDFADLSHRLKGLCGIFSLVEGGLPKDPEVRQNFSQGINKMRDMIKKLDADMS